MAADNLSEIDLYDNIDEDFVQECTDITELYDEVIATTAETVSSSITSVTNTKHSFGTTNSSGRRIALYVGNLTWWTTDFDLIESVAKIGVLDVLEVKFHENRQNGQSKGFCVMVFGSDQSVRLVMDKLPGLEIHGQNPVVTTCTKHNLNVFEKATESDLRFGRHRSEETSDSDNSMGTNKAFTGVSNGLNSRLAQTTLTTPASLGFSLRNTAPLMEQAVPNANFANTLASSIQRALGSQRINSAMNNNGLTTLNLNFPTSTNVMIPPAVAPTALAGNVSSILNTNFSVPTHLPTTLAVPNAQLNPSFLQHPPPANISGTVQAPGVIMPFSAIPPNANRIEDYGRSTIHTYTSSKLSESEFEDILHRNKIVSSSAINRAVQDAASGDYVSAIDTLATAISLIKQSKIANNDRCRILITSLQETLHGIESKSYGSKSNSSRRRRRSYSGSGSENGLDGSYSSSSRRHRDRSNRSRSRDRHDRYERRRRSRDCGSGGRGYYGSGSNASLSNSNPSSTQISEGGSSQNLISGSDRYREGRHRH